MSIDWNFLQKWDVIFGILGGIVLVFSGVRWIVKHAKSSRFARLVAWAIIGEDDETALSTTLKVLLKFVFAGLVWAIIGAFVAVIIVSSLIIVDISMGTHVQGIAQGLFMAALIGAVLGATFRVIAWPVFVAVHQKWRTRKSRFETTREEFTTQKQRVESKLKKWKDE